MVINASANKLKVGYPILVTGTKVGSGLTSINGVNASVVGIGTTFVDNIYIVKTIATNAALGEIVCDVHTNSNSSIISWYKHCWFPFNWSSGNDNITRHNKLGEDYMVIV